MASNQTPTETQVDTGFHLPTVFISHASEDQAIAAQVCTLLEANGIGCWIAPRNVSPGRGWGEQIIEGIESARVMVLLLSANANASAYVHNEVERAISKGKVVIPFRIQDVQPSRSLELFVSTSQWIDAWAPPLQARVHVLAVAIQGLLSLPPLQGDAARIQVDQPIARPPTAGDPVKSLASRRRMPIVAALGVLGLALVVGAGVLGFSAFSGAHAISTAAPPSLAATAVQPSGSGPAAGASSTADARPWSFDSTLAAMNRLRATTAAGSGLVGVITTYGSTEIDAAFRKEFAMADYASTDFRIDDVQSGDAEIAAAQADIDLGAKVLVVRPIDTMVGNQVEALAAQHSVALITIARPIFQGRDTYYAGFQNVQVGKLMGDAFQKCVKDWGVSQPMVFEVDGGQDIDPNATEFALGYNASIWGKASTPLAAGVTNGAGYTLVGEQYIPGWDYNKAKDLFGQSFTDHPQINATLEANDGLANEVIRVLKAKGVPAKKIPTIGQDATLQAMGNILEGYQCGTVYKPAYMDTQAAIALATFLRADQKPPATLLTAQVTDPSGSGLTQPAVLAIGGIWVDASNMASTVLKDGFVSASDLCNAVGAKVCSAAGITP